MTNYKRDTEHSWDEIDDAIDRLLDALKLGRGRDKAYQYLPEHLGLWDIRFLTARCQEMDDKSLDWFRTFLWEGMELSSYQRRDRISRTAHTLCIGAVLFPLLSKTDANYVGFVEALIPRAKRELSSCRPRVLSNDYITENDLPLMRGQLFELILESLLADPDGFAPRRSGDNEHCAWMGEHVDDVFSVIRELKTHRSMDPALIRSLVSNPLSEGTL
jgi:hypothetical protein